MSENVISKESSNENTFRLISYALVFLMMTCFIRIIGILIHNALPNWPADIMAVLTILVVFEHLYTHKKIKSLIPYKREWFIMYGAQALIMIIAIKTLLSFANGLDAFSRDIASFSNGQFGELFSLDFAFTLLLAFLFWNISGRFLKLLDELGLDIATTPTNTIPSQQNNVSPHQRLVNLTLQLGVVLVILTVLTRIHITELYNSNGTLKGLKSFSGAESVILYYFVFGFALFCLSRLMSLQTYWNRNSISVATNSMVTQWGIYSFIFLLILIAIVGFLSSNGNIGMLAILKILFSIIGSIFFFIGQLFILLFTLPFESQTPVQGALSPTPTPIFTTPTPTPTPQAAPIPVDPTLALIRAILLWGSLLMVVVFSFSRLVKLHGGFQAVFRNMALVKWLTSLWAWLKKNTDSTRKALSRTIADAWQRVTSQAASGRLFPRPSWVNLNSLDPRRQIYFFYLAMIRRGSDKGIVRKPSQTPSEYAVILEDALPEQNKEIQTITESFMEARYSPHPIGFQKANRVKAAWNQLRRALQNWKKPKSK